MTRAGTNQNTTGQGTCFQTTNPAPSNDPIRQAAELDRFHVAIDELPVLICRRTVVLRNPSNREIVDCLGFNEGIDQKHVRDLIVLGAGPRGIGGGRVATLSAWRQLWVKGRLPSLSCIKCSPSN